MPPKLTLDALKTEAGKFAGEESARWEPSLFGITDGKAVGTYFEHKFREHLRQKYEYREGSSASGIDFPELGVDVKVTSIRQPQSSCPFRSARQKVYGLGYSLLVFVYEKLDDPSTSTSKLTILHTIFVHRDRTGDFQTTTGLRRILDNQGNKDDLLAFIEERRLPLDEVGASALADEILAKPPKVGYLTVSNALQWRLQYRRVIELAGEAPGVERLR